MQFAKVKRKSEEDILDFAVQTANVPWLNRHANRHAYWRLAAFSTTAHNAYLQIKRAEILSTLVQRQGFAHLDEVFGLASRLQVNPVSKLWARLRHSMTGYQRTTIIIDHTFASMGYSLGQRKKEIRCDRTVKMGEKCA